MSSMDQTWPIQGQGELGHIHHQPRLAHVLAKPHQVHHQSCLVGVTHPPLSQGNAESSISMSHLDHVSFKCKLHQSKFNFSVLQITEFDLAERKQAKLQKQTHKISSEEVFEEVSVNMAEEGDQRKTLGDFTVPTTASCGSSIVRPTVEANSFELKPVLIHLVQQD
ncbi:hypothetical protein PIB30_086769 [Stylosanthes scabra]|uniref:Uncharacterized protein n=1 Tax=Stylosanthes scabra TaxID=79078 RepID=A0ABU6ZRY6_9FABA|nr:hypothetical protein [Stylosanthes scabra]